ncbi:MAG: DUF1344 domain-containing protein, partial [Pseudomonadota bacterium]
MKTFLPIAAAVSLALTAFAHAGEAQGTITAIDPAAMTMTLDTGDTYTLPAEFD